LNAFSFLRWSNTLLICGPCLSLTIRFIYFCFLICCISFQNLFLQMY
jgi:hypothetical protein